LTNSPTCLDALVPPASPRISLGPTEVRGLGLTDKQVQDRLDRADKIVEYQKFAREVAVIIPEYISDVSQDDADETSMKTGTDD